VRARTLGLIVAAAALLSACGAPSAALLPTSEPRGEVLAYYAPTAPVLAVIDTDPDGKEAQALAAALARAGAVDRLAAEAQAQGILFSQVRPLLGGELAIGVPRPGAPPLAVLVAEDGSALKVLAESRVVGGYADPAGSYRGAALYAGHGHAYGVRNRVLLVSRRTSDLRDALDQRASDDAFKGEDLELAVPEVRGDTVARIVVDARGEVPARVRGVPWLAAVETLGVAVRATEEGATLDFSLNTEGEDLLEVDVPVSPGKRGPLAVTAQSPSLTVRDLAHVAGVIERAVRAAFPLAALRLDQGRRTLRHEGGVDLLADVLARLHGPATFIRTRDAVLMRADPSRPRALERALDRFARVLPSALERARIDGFAMRELGGFHELLRDGEIVGRVGMIGDVLVAGTGTPRALRSLARAPLARPAGAAGGLTVAVPQDTSAAFTRDRLGLPLPWRLDGWARGGRDELRGAIHVAW
jgi:hypothetical protein